MKKIQKPDGIIFDVDGTLWDSTDTVAQAWNEAIRRFGGPSIHLDGSRLKTLFGKPMDVICRELFPDLAEDERSRLEELCYECEHRHLAEKPGALYPGVVPTLISLSRETPLYIVSNCQRGYIEILLDASGLGPYISGHLCFGQTRLSKAGTMLRLMERAGLRRAVYIGDTQGDLEACAEAGVPFIFASYGFGSALLAQYRIESMAELPILLQAISK